MKKNRLFTITVILCSIFLSSCYNPVFYEIRKDVKPEETKLKSPINQITRFTVENEEFLTVISDGGIRYKKTNSEKHDDWLIFNNLPIKMHTYNYSNTTHEGEMLLGLFASSDTLYLLTAQYSVDEEQGTTYPSKISLWGKSVSSIKLVDPSKDHNWKSDSGWDLILSDSDDEYFPIYQYDDYYYSAFSIFQTNAVQNSNRKVFLRVGDSSAEKSSFRNLKYYELSQSSIKPLTIENSQIVDSSSTNCVQSAVSFNGDVLFFNSCVATTNETKDNPATKFYYGSGGSLYYGTSVTQTKKTLTISKTDISALAVCSDVILIGCADWDSTSIYNSAGGIYKTTLNDGIPAESTVNFTTNATFQITTSYYVTCLLNATPEKTEKNSSLYCASQIFGNDSSKSGSTSNVGLWSYYPERGNWNRE